MIHRDIKPQNIIIGHHGEVQLLDWGVARRLERYYNEWVNEVLGQLHAPVTPAEHILGGPTPTTHPPSDREGSGEDSYDSFAERSMQSTIGESIELSSGQHNDFTPQSICSTDDSLMGAEPVLDPDLAAETLLHNLSHDQDSSASTSRDETVKQGSITSVVDPRQAALGRFSVSSESPLDELQSVDSADLSWDDREAIVTCLGAVGARYLAHHTKPMSLA